MKRKNIKLLIEYDGTRYIGWQRQVDSHGQSIQGVLENALENLAGHPVSLNGAGRTDSGVHARGQVANFYLTGRMPVDRIPVALAGMLPDDIVVKSAEEVDPNFHARFDAIEKTYRYTILLPGHRSPFEWRYALYQPFPLDIPAMEAAAAMLLGQHDFRTFCSAHSSVKGFVRTVRECRFSVDGEHLYLDITANGFLYNMVRIIMGTLLEVGRGRWQPERVEAALARQDRSLAGPTAKAHGLTLMRIKYPDPSGHVTSSQQSG